MQPPAQPSYEVTLQTKLIPLPSGRIEGVTRLKVLDSVPFVDVYQATAAQADPILYPNQATPLGSIQVSPLLQHFRGADSTLLVFRQLPNSAVVPMRVLD